MSIEQLWMHDIIELNQKMKCNNFIYMDSRKKNTRVLLKSKRFKKLKTPLEIEAY